MDNENKCCGTCYWHKKCCGEFQCFNESAEGFAIETAYDDGKDCEEWGGAMMEQKPLTIEELKEMAGQPVWCPDEEAYGIVMCDKIGQWAGIPFLHGVWYGDGNGCGVEFNHNIIKRRLRCYRTISEKDIPKPLVQKAAFGGVGRN